MGEKSRKHFGPIRDDYAFFQTHSTEAEADLRDYMLQLRGLSEDGIIRMLDFGCGDGGFTGEFLGRSCFAREKLWLSLVEPDIPYLQQATDRLHPFTEHPIHPWATLPSDFDACFELILANHVLYYVPDLTDALSALLGTLAVPGLLLVAMGGRSNALAQYCFRCLDAIGKPFPFWLSEDFEIVMARLGVAYDKAEIHYELVCPDSEENRLSLGRFVMGSDYQAVPRDTLLDGLTPYSHAGQIIMPLVHMHFIVRRKTEGRNYELGHRRARADRIFQK
jgi:SAM-dependent methyltransferase